MDIEKEIEKHRKILSELQERKRKHNRPKSKKSLRPKGRPSIEPEKIQLALQLAKEFPITDVALQLGISMSTLYAKGVKRYLINAQMANDMMSIKE